MKYFSLVGKLVSARGNERGVSLGIEHVITNAVGEKVNKIDYIGVFKPELIKKIASLKSGVLLFIKGIMGNQKVISKTAIDVNTKEFCEYWKESSIATEINEYHAKEKVAVNNSKELFQFIKEDEKPKQNIDIKPEPKTLDKDFYQDADKYYQEYQNYFNGK